MADVEIAIGNQSIRFHESRHAEKGARPRVSSIVCCCWCACSVSGGNNKLSVRNLKQKRPSKQEKQNKTAHTHTHIQNRPFPDSMCCYLAHTKYYSGWNFVRCFFPSQHDVRGSHSFRVTKPQTIETIVIISICFLHELDSSHIRLYFSVAISSVKNHVMLYNWRKLENMGFPIAQPEAYWVSLVSNFWARKKHNLSRRLFFL